MVRAFVLEGSRSGHSWVGVILCIESESLKRTVVLLKMGFESVMTVLAPARFLDYLKTPTRLQWSR